MSGDAGTQVSVAPAVSRGQAGGLGAIFRDSAIGYAGIIAMVALAMVTKIVLARVLSPANLGLLLSGQAIIGLAQTVAQLNLPEAVVRYVGLHAGRDLATAKGALWAGLSVSVAGSAIVAVALCVAAPAIAGTIYQQADLTAVLILFAAAMPLNAVAGVLAAAHRGIGELWAKIVYTDVGPAIWIVAGLAGLFVLGHASLLAVAAVYVTASLLAAVAMALRYRASAPWRLRAARFPVAEMLRFSVPLLAGGLLAWPLAAIPLVVGAFDSMEAVAYYSLALSVAAFVYTSVAAAEAAVFPIWSRQVGAGALDELRRDYAATTRWCLVTASVIFVPVAVAPGTIVTMLYGPGYIDAAMPLRAVSLMFLVNAATGPNESLLKALGETRWILIARMCVGAAAVVSTPPLLAWYGMAGAVAAYIIASMVGIALYAARLLVRHGMHPVDRAYVQFVAALTPALGAALWVHWLLDGSAHAWGVMAITGAYVTVGLVGLYILGGTPSREMEALGRLLRGVRSRAR